MKNSRSFFWTFFVTAFFVIGNVQAQAIFACKTDADCQVADICGEAYSVNQTKVDAARNLLGEKGCAPVRQVRDLSTHNPYCSIDKQCAMRFSVAAENKLEACESAEGAAYEDCVINEAKTKKDPALCKGMGHETNNFECETLVQNMLQAEKNLTENFCKNVSESNALDCWSSFARQENNPEYCFSFDDKEKVVTCLGRPEDMYRTIWTKLTPNICGAAGNIGLKYWADVCYYHVALKLDDTQVCESIKTFQPFYKCYQKIAEARNDPDLCMMVETRGVYPANYPRSIFSEAGCRYGVAHKGNYSGLARE